MIRRSLYFVMFLIILLFSSNSGAGIDNRKINSLIPSESKKNKSLGIFVKSLKTKKVVFSYNSKKNFVPASNNKIVSSFVALSLLGKNFRFKTEFYSGGDIYENVLHGGLYVKGYGDPTLDYEKLNEIAKRLYMMGIREIRDGIYIDNTYFDEKSYGEGWKREWKGDYYSPPIGALSLNYNTVEIHVTASKLGKKAYVTTFPRSSSVKIVNKTRTKNVRSKVIVGYNGNKELVVSGNISPRKKKIKYTVAVLDPTLYFGTVLKNVLVYNGIKVEGGLRVHKTPRWSNKIFDHYSETLDSIVYEYNKESINIIGESIVKILGAKFIDEPGSWEKGNSVISRYLRNIGIEGEFNIVDGSGLSVLNKLSPETLSDILVRAYDNSEISEAFILSLPIAGIDGTLEKRFRNSDIKGNVYAKTGYLNGVRSLSGYAFSKDGEIFVFSIISNGILGPKIKRFQTKLLEELVN